MQIPLNTQIIAYLTVNNIAYSEGDYQTGIPTNGVDQILYWNTEKLGAQPTQTQLNEAYPIYENQQIAAQNKEKAVTLLQQTDWASIADIADPVVSNPYLMNRPEFLSYRSQVRSIAVYPTPDAVFPKQPIAIWSN